MERPIPIFNIPNLLTLLRLVSLPGIILLARAGFPVAACGLFVAGMVSDCFDGYLARRWGQCTPLGLYLDPAVDKIVILTLFYELAQAGSVDWAVAHLFLARELLLSAVRATAGVQGRIVGANWMGKTKAALQSILIGWGMLLPVWGVSPGHWLRGMLSGAAWLVVVLSWISLGIFLYWNRSLFAGEDRS
ncbi:MAG TPA: CDP-diacylglycerol--glycerol-3-phosphate 3-phosphatidyltransferase [Candidatus Sumerlaeota bacterium]|nr:CDP-diacylglycerol--glycerol-3-phosphate 3-phosphatidyltransferase [Candidatus Sumerlaeota bacterium]HPS01138.1 CDP-diacylglycerol--glycerol-3-phosphate 3-phosphatidyltransferase [Candidatus Sumerlaeota bacterium]